MIHVITGVPGSGKSYWAVNYLYTKYCDDNNGHIDTSLDVKIISNVDELKIHHDSLDLLLENHRIDQIINNDAFKKLKEKYKRVIFLIDEAQRYLTKENYESMQFAFEYHRHFGIEFLLLTQDKVLLPYKLLKLAEYLVVAQPRSRSVDLPLIGSFRYKYFDNSGYVELSQQNLKKNQKIFNLYQSFEFDETEKPKNMVNRYALVIGIFVLFVGYMVAKIFIFKDIDVTPGVEAVAREANKDAQILKDYRLKTEEKIKNFAKPVIDKIEVAKLPQTLWFYKVTGVAESGEFLYFLQGSTQAKAYSNNCTKVADLEYRCSKPIKQLKEVSL
jgi:hypothetical protein